MRLRNAGECRPRPNFMAQEERGEPCTMKRVVREAWESALILVLYLYEARFRMRISIGREGIQVHGRI